MNALFNKAFEFWPTQNMPLITFTYRVVCFSQLSINNEQRNRFFGVRFGRSKNNNIIQRVLLTSINNRSFIHYICGGFRRSFIILRGNKASFFEIVRSSFSLSGIVGQFWSIPFAVGFGVFAGGSEPRGSPYVEACPQTTATEIVCQTHRVIKRHRLLMMSHC